jgi:hypothetical protein
LTRTPRAGTLPRAGVKLLKKKESSMKKSLIVIAVAALLSQPVLATPPTKAQTISFSLLGWLKSLGGGFPTTDPRAASEMPGHDPNRSPAVSTASEQPGHDSVQPDHD